MNNETLRDKIASCVRDYDGYNGNSSEVSDDILATIKTSVPPLIWARNGVHWAGGNGYVIRKIGSQYTLTIRNQNERQFETLEAAQAAAQSHHVAQRTGWMMK